eukprot:TRINITY_DN27144_c0_g1_i1.p1 TRINITY_DN27144_c0_g1~~TRINITY_DN27144_c0_g1_i1.p1  ORF type:complete len:733 (+),score=169.19 TRINITY_DN27144_c0_g1_i1:140-2338(+)
MESDPAARPQSSDSSTSPVSPASPASPNSVSFCKRNGDNSKDKIAQRKHSNKNAAPVIVGATTKSKPTALLVQEDVSTRQIIYALLDPGQPASSKALAWAATAISIAIFVLIYLSIVVFCLESHPYFYKKSNATLNALEIFCVSIFTLDLIVRFGTVDDRKQFCKQFLNWVDFVSILPFYIEVLVHAFQGGSFAVSSFVFLRVLRLARVFRVFKVGKYNTGLQLVICAMRQSTEALSLLGFLLGIALVLFASLVFIAEQTESTFDVNETLWYYDTPNEDGVRVLSNFQSIPASMWWALVTLSTVGYGDMVPRTWFGKCVGMLCMVGGVLVIAFPIILISNNFSDAVRVYAEQLQSEDELDGTSEGRGEDSETLREAHNLVVRHSPRPVPQDSPTHKAERTKRATDDNVQVQVSISTTDGDVEMTEKTDGDLAGEKEPNGAPREELVSEGVLKMHSINNSAGSSASSSAVARENDKQPPSPQARDRPVQLSPGHTLEGRCRNSTLPISPVSDLAIHAAEAKLASPPPRTGSRAQRSCGVVAYFRHAHRLRPIAYSGPYGQDLNHFEYEPICCVRTNAQGVVDVRVSDKPEGHRTVDFDLILDSDHVECLAADALARTELFEKARLACQAYHVARLEVDLCSVLQQYMVTTSFEAPGSRVVLSFKIPNGIDIDAHHVQQLLAVSSLDCALYKDKASTVPDLEVTVPLATPPPGSGAPSPRTRPPPPPPLPMLVE